MHIYYTYLLTYSTGKHYHGVRKCSCQPEDDIYYGSSNHTPDEIPHKTILSTHTDGTEAFLTERSYHIEHSVDVNEQYYNKSIAFGNPYKKPTKKKVSSALGKVMVECNENNNLRKPPLPRKQPKTPIKNAPPCQEYLEREELTNKYSHLFEVKVS